MGAHHAVVLAPLQAGTTYYYTIGTGPTDLGDQFVRHAFATLGSPYDDRSAPSIAHDPEDPRHGFRRNATPHPSHMERSVHVAGSF